MKQMPLNDTRNDCAPPRLLKALAAAGSERALSRVLGVNILYVSQLLRRGIEPTDQTEKGREVRVKLFLPKRKRKPGPRKAILPIQKQIREMAKDTADAVVRRKPIKKVYDAVKVKP